MLNTKICGLTALALVAALAGCTAEVEQKGRAPDVDVDPGRLPKVDIDPAQVQVSQDTHRIVTPDIDVVPAKDKER